MVLEYLPTFTPKMAQYVNIPAPWLASGLDFGGEIEPCQQHSLIYNG